MIGEIGRYVWRLGRSLSWRSSIIDCAIGVSICPDYDIVRGISEVTLTQAVANNHVRPDNCADTLLLIRRIKKGNEVSRLLREQQM